MAYFEKQTHATPEIVSVDRAKEQLKIDAGFEGDDALISDCIEAAIDDAENYTGTHIRESVFLLKNKCFVQDMPLTKSPVQAITLVEYFDANNDKQTLDPDKYELIPIDDFQHKIVFQEMPDVYQTRSDAVVITLTLGFKANETPKSIVMAVLMMLSTFYENREDHVYKLPTRAMSLLRKYRFHL